MDYKGLNTHKISRLFREGLTAGLTGGAVAPSGGAGVGRQLIAGNKRDAIHKNCDDSALMLAYLILPFLSWRKIIEPCECTVCVILRTGSDFRASMPGL